MTGSVEGATRFVGDGDDGREILFSADAELKQLAEQRVGQPKKIPEDMWHYRNEKSNWGVVGTPFPMFFSGDRIYRRTWFNVYCIGDSGQKTVLSPRHR